MINYICTLNVLVLEDEAFSHFSQEVASRLGLLHGSVRHYGMNGDVNSLLLMADIVLYASSQDEQGFPPLLIRAMSFGVPVISPDFPVIKKHVSSYELSSFFPCILFFNYVF